MFLYIPHKNQLNKICLIELYLAFLKKLICDLDIIKRIKSQRID